ncbi:MAG: hypothetical protein OEM97_04610, partial [Acidimicrobiia bacterium]|nr:hypothetical protein [Acidimicrobiia bacterium]
MRIVRWGAFVTWLIVAGLAVAGFAAFSPRPVTSVVVDPSSSHSFADGRGSATGRVLAVAFAIGTRSTDVTIVGSDPAVGRRDPDADQPLAATANGMPPAQSAPLTPATTESAPTTLVAGPTVPVD